MQRVIYVWEYFMTMFKIYYLTDCAIRLPWRDAKLKADLTGISHMEKHFKGGYAMPWMTSMVFILTLIWSAVKASCHADVMDCVSRSGVLEKDEKEKEKRKMDSWSSECIFKLTLQCIIIIRSLIKCLHYLVISCDLPFTKM